MMIIDSHLNITRDGKWFNTNYNASFERLLVEMKECGVEKGLLISILGEDSNVYISEICNKFPKKFRGIGLLDLNNMKKSSILKQLKIIKTLGLIGIKFHPRLQGVLATERKLDIVWRYCEKNDMLVMFDTYFQSSNKNISLGDLTPFHYDTIAKRYSQLKIILAHAGAHRVLDTYFVGKSNKNVYVDISYSLQALKGTSVEKDYLFLIKNLSDRVLFGSDFPEISIKKALNDFFKIKISEEIKQKILYDNAKELFKFSE